MKPEFDDTPAIYVDVDGTLLMWPGKPGHPPRKGEPGYGEAPAVNWPLANRLRDWHKFGENCLVLWSRGGAHHARRAAIRCGLSPDACLPKPRIAIDDAPNTVTAGDARRGFIVIGPHEVDKVPA